jgi:hypothetical protein
MDTSTITINITYLALIILKWKVDIHECVTWVAYHELRPKLGVING